MNCFSLKEPTVRPGGITVCHKFLVLGKERPAPLWIMPGGNGVMSYVKEINVAAHGKAVTDKGEAKIKTHSCCLTQTKEMRCCIPSFQT